MFTIFTVLFLKQSLGLEVKTIVYSPAALIQNQILLFSSWHWKMQKKNVCPIIYTISVSYTFLRKAETITHEKCDD